MAAEAFRQLDPAVVFDVKRPDGSREPGDAVASVRGAAAALLTAERTALNFLQRLSGIATVTRRYVDAAAAASRFSIRERRRRPCARWKTPSAPAAARIIERADDGILIKDNHVRLAGGMAEAVKRMKEARREMPIEVEAQSLKDVDAGLDGRR